MDKYSIRGTFVEVEGPVPDHPGTLSNIFNACIACPGGNLSFFRGKVSGAKVRECSQGSRLTPLCRVITYSQIINRFIHKVLITRGAARRRPQFLFPVNLTGNAYPCGSWRTYRLFMIANPGLFINSPGALYSQAAGSKSFHREAFALTARPTDVYNVG